MRAPALLALLLLAAAPARAAGEPQTLIDRGTLAVQEMLETGDPAAIEDARGMLRRARAVMVCPQVFRAGFILGGEAGGCALLARDAAGSWSSPAFYGMASGSFGLQIGIQDMQVLMMILTDRGLSAVMDSQFKFGADLSIAVATIGAGVEGSTTAAAGADIVALARSRGLFAGVALEGSLLTSRNAWNREYYGQEVSPRQIVVAMQAHNPGVDPLRAVLMRYGAAAGGPAATGGGAVQRGGLPPIAPAR
jgi:lipid-binding SYLF domain-containing protein